MRLRASFTVENSFIIPFFTMIIVVMVILALDMHDELIGKAVKKAVKEALNKQESVRFKCIFLCQS